MTYTAPALPVEAQAFIDATFARNRETFGHGLFFMEEGGAPAADAGTGEGEPEGAGEPAGVEGHGTGEPEAPVVVEGAAEPAAEKVEDLPEWAQKIIRETRDEAAKNRTSKTAAEEQQAGLLKAVATALGLDTAEGEQEAAPTVEDLTASLTERETALREARTENAVVRYAAGAGVNSDRLLDSRAFVNTITSLDPTADDFAARVKTAVDAAVTTDPSLKVRATVQGGADLNGGTGEAPNGDDDESPEAFLKRLQDSKKR